jgi:DHA1 family bicyclomycin/chloramphenicol resistance-like MFS transporter
MGPLVGEILIIFYDWHAVFLILTICGLIMLFISIYEVKETLPKKMRIRNIEIKKPLIRIANDKELITNTISIGLIIGLISAYYIEAPFLIIKIFNLSRKHYEFSMIFILIGGLIGGYLSKKLTDNHNAIDLANKASTFSVIISAIFLTTIYLLEYCGIPYNNPIFLIITITSLTLLVTSNAITSSQVQAIALQNYSNSIGITTAFFNAGYVIIGSAITYMIGLFHTSSIFYMPFIFFTICVLMFLNSIKMRELQTKYF